MEKFVDCFVYSISGDFKNITSDDATKFKKLNEKLINEDLILSYEKQIRFDIQITNGKPPEPVKKVIKKPQLISEDENTLIKFNDDTISFWTKNMGKETCTTDKEAIKIKKYINLISSIYNINSKGITFDVDFIIKNFTDIEVEGIYRLFLNPQITEYSDSNPKQWQVALTKKENLDILGLESLVTMLVGRGDLQKEGEEYKDLILIHLNIKTTKKLDVTITKSQIESIFDKFYDTYKKIYSELEVKVDEITNNQL